MAVILETTPDRLRKTGPVDSANRLYQTGPVAENRSSRNSITYPRTFPNLCIPHSAFIIPHSAYRAASNSFSTWYSDASPASSSLKTI